LDRALAQPLQAAPQRQAVLKDFPGQNRFSCSILGRFVARRHDPLTKVTEF
jgi:hypothetical protein